MKKTLRLVLYAICISFGHLHAELRMVLPVQSISAMAQDSLGFIWYGGSDGLVRFDGNATERFLTSDQVPYYGFINHIDPMNQSGEFILCTSDGLYGYNYITNTFRNLTPVLNSINITSILFTSSHQYIVGTHKGVYVFDESFEHFSLVFPHSQHVNCILEDSEQNLFIGTDAGLELLRATENGYQCQLLTRGRTRFIYEDKGGRLWFSRLGGVCYAPCKELKQGQTNTIKAIVQDIDIVTASAFDEQLWVATRGQGITRIAMHEQPQVLPPIFISSQNEEIANTTQALMQDKDNNIWVGTIDGLYVYTHPAYHGFHQVRSTDEPFSLSNNIISTIHITPSNKVWIGTACGINKLEWKNNKISFVTYYDNSREQYYVDDNRIQMIAQAGNGRFIISTKYHIRLFDPNTGDFIQDNAIDSICRQYGKRFVRSYFQDTVGNIWMAFNEGGLGVWIPKLQRFQHIEWTDYKPDIHRTIVRSNDGSLWVSSDTEGLWQLSINEGLNQITSSQLYPRSILNNQYITAHTITKDGDIWCGTFNGLFRNFEPVPLLSVEEQVYVSSLQEDAQGYLWVVGTHGLYRVNTDGQEVRYYEITANHDLTKLWYIIGTGLAPDSTLYVGGVDGLLYFKPHQIQEEHNMTPPVITRVNINNTYHPFLPTADKQIWDINYSRQPICLSANDNQISFEFAALRYTDRSNISYAYRLSGVNKDWIPTDGSRRYAAYSNLPPGRYTFSVRSTNNFGEQTDNIRSVNFIISRPWYSTWWAILSYLLLGGLVFFFLFRFHILTTELKRLHYSLTSPLKLLFRKVIPQEDQEKHPYIEPIPIPNIKHTSLLINCEDELADALDTHLNDLFKIKIMEYTVECKEFIRKEQPEIILIEQHQANDANMICREITEGHKKDTAATTPLIMILSAQDSEENQQAAYLAGASAWMNHTVSVSVIRAHIIQMLKHKEMMSEQIRQSLIVNPKQVNVLADSDVFMANVMQIIEDNINNDHFTIEQMASKLCVSSSGLYRRIKEETKMSPNEYIRYIRLNRAAKLLESQKYKVYEICYMVGFTDQRYFATCFRSQFGQTPKAYQLAKKGKTNIN